MIVADEDVVGGVELQPAERRAAPQRDPGVRGVGAAFVDGAAGDRESGDAFARAVRSLFGQVPGNDGGVIIYYFLGNYILRLVVKPVNPGEFAFRYQFRLCLQPMLNIVTGQRTLVLITEVGSSGHFVR